MKNALLMRRLDDFGDLLHSAWESKKNISPRISNTWIDEMYETARKSGAIGGKITGAGGGGYMLLYCEFEKKHKVVEAMKKLGAMPTEFAFEGKGLHGWRIHETGVRHLAVSDERLRGSIEVKRTIFRALSYWTLLMKPRFYPHVLCSFDDPPL